MTAESKGGSQTIAPELENVGNSRRSMLKGLALMGGGAMMLQPRDVMAMMQEHTEASAENATVQQISEHARATSLPKEAYDLPRWTPKQTGPYDLSKPLDNHYAFAKTQANLAGEYSFLAQYGLLFLAPPGEPAFPWLGKLTFVQIFVTAVHDEPIPDAGEHDYVLWGTFNDVWLNPRTFEPIETAYNPYLDKTIDVQPLEFADRLAYRYGKSIIVPGVDPKFYDQPWDRDGGYSQHHIDAGDEVAYGVLGAAQLPGPLQPRIDYAFWASKKDDLMNPSKPSIDCRRDYTSLMKLSEYPWMGAERGDQAQILQHMTGIKTQNPARLPDFVEPLIFDRYPGRYVL
jgi:hypothetical protein